MLEDIFLILKNSPQWKRSRNALECGENILPEQQCDSIVDCVDSSKWTKLASSGIPPPVRSGHSATVVGSMMYVFGGYNEGTCHNDLYSFDLVRHHWQRIENPTGISPDGRASHACCTSNDQRKLYLFGGSGPQWGQTNMGILLQFDLLLKNWSVVPARGCCPNPGYGQTLCAIGDELLLFGGTSGHVYVNVLHAFNTVTGVWRRVHYSGSAPSCRYKHQAIVVDRSMYILGGGLYDAPAGLMDVYCLNYDTATWSKVDCHGDIPSGRLAHAAVYVPHEKGQILVFGGRTASGNRTNDLYILDLVDKRWTKPQLEEKCWPQDRDFHTAVEYNGQMFVFGGSNGSERSNDIFRYRSVISPPTLAILCLKAIRIHQHRYSEEELRSLPHELAVGIASINPHVVAKENLYWVGESTRTEANGFAF